MNDKELLELAAKAARLTYRWNNDRFEVSRGEGKDEANYPILLWKKWNPLENDADAFELAVELRINICFSNLDDEDDDYTWCKTSCGIELDDDFPHRAIVRTAAEMGRKL